MTASVGPPALTMMTAVRGFVRCAANSSYENAGTNSASGCSATSSSVLARLRLNTATELPSRLARLRARFDPITARPTTPMFAVAVLASAGPVGVGAGRSTSSGAGAPSCATVAPAGASSRSVETLVWAAGSAFEGVWDTRAP